MTTCDWYPHADATEIILKFLEYSCVEFYKDKFH